MKRSTFAALVLLPALVVAATPPASDPAARTALLQTDTEWAKAASVGKDVEKILSYWSDDAVVYPPGQLAVSGKAAIRNYVSTSFKTPFFSISWKPAQAVVSESGDLGYTMGSNEITTADPSGKVVRAQGRYLTVWRHSGGAWKCVVDFWNESSLPAPPIPKVSAKPSVKPVVSPTPKPSVQPSAKPAVPKTAKPAVQPTPKPVVKPTIKPE
jgi:ketosteroid isomerase-like protein